MFTEHKLLFKKMLDVFLVSMVPCYAPSRQTSQRATERSVEDHPVTQQTEGHMKKNYKLIIRIQVTCSDDPVFFVFYKPRGCWMF